MIQNCQRSSSTRSNVSNLEPRQTSTQLADNEPPSPSVLSRLNPNQARTRGGTFSDSSSAHSAPYRPGARAATPWGQTHQQPQRLPLLAAAMESRNQYIPGPPPVVQSLPPQNNMMSLPPPPPRPPPTQAVHNMLPPPPPGPFPGPPQGMTGSLSANWLGQNWNRSAMLPPPPPMQMGSVNAPHYNSNHVYQPHQPPPISIPSPKPIRGFAHGKPTTDLSNLYSRRRLFWSWSRHSWPSLQPTVGFQ